MVAKKNLFFAGVLAFVCVLAGCGIHGQSEENNSTKSDVAGKTYAAQEQTGDAGKASTAEEQNDDSWMDYYTFIETQPQVYHEAAEGFSQGSGTEQDPYIIMNAEELRFLCVALADESINSKYEKCYYELGADIVLNEGKAEEWRDNPPEYFWDPIAKRLLPGTYFMGHFDGKGHSISGMYVRENYDESLGSHELKYGLFGRTKNAIIQNVSIINSYICITGYGAPIGGIAGSLMGSTQIINCSSEAIIDVYDGTVGGIVGECDEGCEIENCTFSGSIRSFHSGEIGGIVGFNYGRIKECTNYGNIMDDDQRTEYVGGILGCGWEGSVYHCVNYGGIAGGGATGGIAGRFYSMGNTWAEESGLAGEKLGWISDCQNHGFISSSLSGGIVGQVDGGGGVTLRVTNCLNDGELSKLGERVGGIVGKVSCGGEGVIIEYCTNMADVEATLPGGIVGYVHSADDFTLNMRNCVNKGNVKTNHLYAGGILGEVYAPGDKKYTINIGDCENEGTVETLCMGGGIIGVLEGHRQKEPEKGSLIALSKCINHGRIIGKAENCCLGGIIGTYGLQMVPAKLEDCENDGKIVTEIELPEGDGSQTFMTVANIFGGIIGRVGDNLYVSIDYDEKDAGYVNGSNAIVLMEGCISNGEFEASGGNELSVSAGGTRIVNCIGGILGNCSAEKDYSVAVKNCSFSNAEKGMGTIGLPEVGTKMD